MPEMTTLAKAQATHARALALFQPITDIEQHGRKEKWSDCFEAMNANKPFKGDCEEFAIVCLEWLHKEHNIPLDQMSLVVCHPKELEGGHLVTRVDGWILDNLQREVVHKNRLYYKWICEWDLTSLTNWRHIKLA